MSSCSQSSHCRFRCRNPRSLDHLFGWRSILAGLSSSFNNRITLPSSEETLCVVRGRAWAGDGPEGIVNCGKDVHIEDSEDLGLVAGWHFGKDKVSGWDEQLSKSFDTRNRWDNTGLAQAKSSSCFESLSDGILSLRLA